MQFPRTMVQLLALCALVTTGTITHAQSLDAEVQQDPAAGLAIYDFHFDGPPRGSAYMFLTPPTLALPSGLIPWTGIFRNQINEPVFSFNFNIQTSGVGQFVLSDGPEVVFPGLPPAPLPPQITGIDPGVTCLLSGGCDPIGFVLPMQFQPILPEPFPIQVDIQLTQLQTNFPESNAFVQIGFVDPDPIAPLLFDPRVFPPIVDPLLNPLFNDPFQLLPVDPLPLDPLAGGPLQLPLPPDPGLLGLSLSYQAIVLDPNPLAPFVRIGNLNEGQNVRVGNSFHITTSPAASVPEPETLALFLLALAGMAYVRRRRD